MNLKREMAKKSPYMCYENERSKFYFSLSICRKITNLDLSSSYFFAGNILDFTIFSIFVPFHKTVQLFDTFLHSSGGDNAFGNELCMKRSVTLQTLKLNLRELQHVG